MSRMNSSNNNIVQRTVELNYNNKKRSISFKWSVINGVFFLIFAYDLSCKCPGHTTILHYVEYALVSILGANLLHHSWRLIPQRHAVVTVTSQQQRLLGLSATDLDSSFRVVDQTAESNDTRNEQDASDLSVSLSPPRVWGRRPSSRSSPSTPSPPSSRLSTSASSPSRTDEFIADQRALHDYLKQYEERNAAEAGTGMNGPQTMPWGAPVPSSAPPLYQLASLHIDSSKSEQGSPPGSPQVWWRLHLDPQRLTQFNLNLRLWLHVTILERLVREMEAVDEALNKMGLSDVRVGQVSVDRLRKTAALPGAGTLPALLPFLESFSDQRYVVQRIRELARGGCLSNYKWNGGGSGWEESKPTDAELVLQLFASYLDGQLPPAGPRPFSTAHLSVAPARPPHAPDALVLHRVTPRPPHYVLVMGEETLEVCRGRNNLLHTLLLFLAAAARSPPARASALRPSPSPALSPAFHRVHLGPAGLNMLWIIGR